MSGELVPIERWRRPAKILDAVEGDALVQMGDDREMVQVNVSVDADTLQRMFEGRICINCLEPLEEPFPEVCNGLKAPDGTVLGCYYRVRKNQLYDLTHRHGALEEVHIGSRVNYADELERMREMDAFEERTGITLPDSVKFPNELGRGER